MAIGTAGPVAGTAPEAIGTSVRMSVARFVITVALAIQILGIADFIFVKSGPAQWLREIRQGNGALITGTVVFAGCLALFSPVVRGRRWALVLAVLVVAFLLPTALPPLVFYFPRPTDFSVWILTTTITLSAVVGIGFGAVALLEAFGKVQAEPFRQERGITAQGVVAAALGAAWLGMTILAYAVAQNPPPGARFAQAPELMLRDAMTGMRFQMASLDLKVGQPTAIFLTNADASPHSFDVDALNIHVYVPAGTTATALVNTPNTGSIPFYCAVPGHREAGMVGTLNVHER